MVTSSISGIKVNIAVKVIVQLFLGHSEDRTSSSRMTLVKLKFNNKKRKVSPDENVGNKVKKHEDTSSDIAIVSEDGNTVICDDKVPKIYSDPKSIKSFQLFVNELIYKDIDKLRIETQKVFKTKDIHYAWLRHDKDTLELENSKLINENRELRMKLQNQEEEVAKIKINLEKLGIQKEEEVATIETKLEKLEIEKKEEVATIKTKLEKLEIEKKEEVATIKTKLEKLEIEKDLMEHRSDEVMSHLKLKILQCDGLNKDLKDKEKDGKSAKEKYENLKEVKLKLRKELNNKKSILEETEMKLKIALEKIRLNENNKDKDDESQNPEPSDWKRRFREKVSEYHQLSKIHADSEKEFNNVRRENKKFLLKIKDLEKQIKVLVFDDVSVFDNEKEEESLKMQSKKPEEAAVITNNRKEVESISTNKKKSHKPSLPNTKTTDKVYCLCQKNSSGDMIACDNEVCKYEWFHFRCVQIKKPPKGEWYCSSVCREEAGGEQQTGQKTGKRSKGM